MLAEAAGLLDAGRGGEAADIFGRVLLLDPACIEARSGLDAARAALAETRRRLDGRLDEAQTAIPHDPERAREILDEVVRDGGDRDRAHALFDRLDGRSGRLDAGPSPRDWNGEAGSMEPPRRRRSPLSRHAFIAGCTIAFVGLAVGLAFSWERIVSGLVKNPAPSRSLPPPSTGVPEPAAGDAALVRARELIRQGDPARALAALDAVSPDDPAYPMARRLRAEALAAMGPRIR
jgi:hypothetical protein